MKVLVTGSHFTPAQAVIEELKKDPDVEIVYLGRKTTREGDKSPSAESQVLPKLGVKFIPVISGRLQRSFTRYTIPSLLKIPFGFLQAFYLLLRERPEVILSFGGYVAVPVVILAWVLSIPVIIHEQTLISGLSNTISAWFADKVAVSFSKNMNLSDGRTILTGNPIRKELFSVNLENASEDIKEILKLAKKEDLPIVLITGGNQGSHVINEAVGGVLEKLTEAAFVIHQTGDSKFRDFELLVEKRKTLKNPQRYLVRKWVEVLEWGAVLRNCDLVISRAGVNTLLELAYFKVPALVVPLPFLYKDEQNENARFFKELGLVEILPQKDLSGENLFREVKQMLGNLNYLKERSVAAESVVIEDAAKRLALETKLLVRGGNEA